MYIRPRDLYTLIMIIMQRYNVLKILRTVVYFGDDYGMMIMIIFPFPK